MSLVVGFASDEIGFLVGDTLITYPSGASYNPREPELEKFHRLKIQIVTPEIAVAFAGDVEQSMETIIAFRRDLTSLSIPAVAERLWELRHRRATDIESLPDFLLLCIAANGAKRLARISDAGISYQKRAYIGDQTEYQNFRRLWKDYEGPLYRQVQHSDGAVDGVAVTDSEKEFDQTTDAMERLTHQRRSATVGAICGCIVRVVEARISKKLEYLQSVESSISPEEGEAGFSLLAANGKDPRGIGIYFRRWQTGLLFIVCDSVPCRKERAATIHEFVALARDKYGLFLAGGMWS
jgi:hypothetical protein